MNDSMHHNPEPVPYAAWVQFADKVPDPDVIGDTLTVTDPDGALVSSFALGRNSEPMQGVWDDALTKLGLTRTTPWRPAKHGFGALVQTGGDPWWLTPCPPGCSWHSGSRDAGGGASFHEVAVYSAPGGVAVGFQKVDTFGPDGAIDTAYEYWFDADELADNVGAQARHHVWALSSTTWADVAEGMARAQAIVDELVLDPTWRGAS